MQKPHWQRFELHQTPLRITTATKKLFTQQTAPWHSDRLFLCCIASNHYSESSINSRYHSLISRILHIGKRNTLPGHNTRSMVTLCNAYSMSHRQEETSMQQGAARIYSKTFGIRRSRNHTNLLMMSRSWAVNFGLMGFLWARMEQRASNSSPKWMWRSSA
jgi:hypothetical protein